MSGRLFIRSIQIKPVFMPAFYESTIYDKHTGLSVACTGETQEESEAEAAKKLAILNSRQEQSSEEPRDYPPWRY